MRQMRGQARNHGQSKINCAIDCRRRRHAVRVGFGSGTRVQTGLRKEEYALHCALCHGLTGDGEGSYNQTLKRPSDLTLLARANKGVFPYRRVYEVIDGRREIEAHGTRDMPIWGTYYQAIASEDKAGVSRAQKTYVRNRISALIAYIQRLQVK